MNHDLNVMALALVAASAVLWSLLSARLERLNITAPIVFVTLGLLLTHEPLSLVTIDLHSAVGRSVAEITLALVLFVDASRVNVHALRADAVLPGRLLALGLPLTVALGWIVGAGIYGGTGLWVVAVIAAAVAPTDAALGAPLLVDERVPKRVRRVLNVESGLNDGLVTPFVGVFLAGAVSAESLGGGQTIAGAAVDLLGGAGVGLVVGAAGAVLLHAAVERGFSAEEARPLAPLALAVLSYSAAVELGTNGFVAAFVGGMAFGSLLPPPLRTTIDFAEEAGALLSAITWFLFGAAMIVPALDLMGWRDVLFAVLALTLVRMLPVAIACTGLGLQRRTVAFIGWFGPRGLASVIFALLAADTLLAPDADRVLTAVTITVVLSVVAHGVTASPFAARYGATVTARHPHGPEHDETGDLLVRTPTRRSRPSAGGEGKPGH